MKLRTLIPVTYNSGITSTSQAIVEGHLENVSISGDGQTLGANYIYTTEPDVDGNVTVLQRSGFQISGEDIDNLYALVQSDIPNNLNYRETEQYKFFLGFRIRMAITFNINPSDIEIL